MKVKRIKLGIRSIDEGLEEAATTMKAIVARQRAHPKGHRLFFTSPEALRRFLSPKRLDLIRVIRQEHPASISELATLTQRDFKRVYEDVKSLAEAGMLELAKGEPSIRVHGPKRGP